MEVQIQTYGNETLGIGAKTVELVVTETEPGIKVIQLMVLATKSATVETGYTLNVPLFVNEGDTLVINTGGSYISRA